jgi:ParB family chromosome partitioning protein
MSDKDTTTDTLTLAIDSIVIGERKRQAHDVQALAESIATLGLLQPIVVTPKNGAYHLVAGYHRLLACRSLGWTTIDAIVLGGDDLLVELSEIDENLIRNELSYLERAEHLARRKEIYEALHPEAKAGYRRAMGMHVSLGHNVDATVASTLTPFTNDTAAQTGLSRSTIQHDVQIATQIAPDVRDVIRDTPLADSKRDLLALASVAPEQQRAALDMVTREEARNPRQAVLKLKVQEQSRSNGAGLARVYHADALDFLHTQPESAFDLLLTDPPYSTDVEDIAAFAQAWLPLALSRINPGGRAYIFTGAYPHELHAYLGVLLSSALSNWHLDNVLVWTYENTMGPSPRYGYKLNWQACFYLYGPDAPDLQSPLLIEQFTVQRMPAPGAEAGFRWHPFEKPIALAERFIRHSTQPGARVLDPFAGTGTFLLAAQNLGRQALGAERDPDMLRICEQRGVHIVSS